MSKKSDETVVQISNNLDTRVALLELSINHVNQTLERMEKRFDKIDMDIKELRNDLSKRIDSRFFWLLTFTIAGFGSLWGTLAHVAHWF